MPELSSYEEKLKPKHVDATITCTTNYNNFILYFNCSLSTIPTV